MHLRIEATVICRFGDSGENEHFAERMLETLEPDNDGYIVSRAEGNDLISTAESGSVLNLRSTLDDLLACLSTAEEVMRTECGEVELKEGRKSGMK